MACIDLAAVFLDEIRKRSCEWAVRIPRGRDSQKLQPRSSRGLSLKTPPMAFGSLLIRVGALRIKNANNPPLLGV